MESITESIAKFITNTSSQTIPLSVINYTKTLTFDAIGTLVAATHPKVTSGKLITEFVESQGGVNEASLIGKKDRRHRFGNKEIVPQYHSTR